MQSVLGALPGGPTHGFRRLVSRNGPPATRRGPNVSGALKSPPARPIITCPTTDAEAEVIVPKFEFPLQTALDLRRRGEEAALQRLAQSRAAAAGIRRELEQAQARSDRLAAGLRDRGAGADVSLGALEHTGRCLADLRRTIAHLHRRLAEADRECELRQAEVLSAARARRTLERLCERQYAEFRRVGSRREQRDLDEIAVQGHRRLRAAS